jgi:GNAT superfamily N-acetyltransferase
MHSKFIKLNPKEYRGIMTELRTMRESDIRHVNLLLSKSFTHANLQYGLKTHRIPLCKQSFLKMYLAANPQGAFVIDMAGDVVAFLFSRLWGTVGWIGPLGVAPEKAGSGYGRQIVSTGVDYLKKQGATTIGLEMTAQSCRNLAFYTKLGFRPAGLTVDLVKTLIPDRLSGNDATFELIRLSELQEEKSTQWLAQLQDLWERLEPGLDYSCEIRNVKQWEFGEARLFVKNDAVCGFVIAHTETYTVEEKKQFLKVNVLQIAPHLPMNNIEALLTELEQWALKAGLHAIYLRVPTRYSEAYEYVLKKNYLIVQNDIRLTLRGFEQRDKPSSVNFSKWE